MRDSITNEQRYYDALKTIARDYMSVEQMERDAKNVGCSVSEYIEMAYENVRSVAKAAIKGKRRPKVVAIRSARNGSAET